MREGGDEDSVGHRVVEAGRGAEVVWRGGKEGKMTPAPLCGRKGHVGEEGDFGVEMGAQGGVLVNMGDSSPCWVLCAQAEGRE